MTPGAANQLALLPLTECFFAGAALVRSRSNPSDSEPDLWLPFQPCDNHRPLSSVARRLQDPLLRCDRDLGWNIDWAVAFFVDHLEQKWDDAAEMLRNIRIRAQSLEDDGLRKEIPYRIFNKLDEVLFAGHLKNAVFLDISSLGCDVSGATYTHRLGPDPDVKRISIILNKDSLVRAKDIVTVLIHHMIHAYFLIACGGQKEEEVDYGRLSHDFHFGKVMLTIKKLSAAHGRELTPLNYGHSLPKMCYLDDEYYSPRWRDELEQEDKEAWYCSHCHHNVQGPSAREVDKWYDNICKSLFTQPPSVREPLVHTYSSRRHELESTRRGTLPPSTKTVEFLHQDIPILVEADKLTEYPSIPKAFAKAGHTRFLKLPDETSPETVLRFLEFLHTGSYSPSPSSSTASDRKPHAPIIIPPSPTTATETPLLTAIQFANFATQMSFSECKTHALSHLASPITCTEDPVAVLTEIYRGGCEPDAELKSWARAFLVAVPEYQRHHEQHWSHIDVAATALSLLGFGGRGPGVGVGVGGSGEPPNLIKLEKPALPYQARFLAAVEASGALENDVVKARAELEARGWYNLSTLAMDECLCVLPGGAARTDGGLHHLSTPLHSRDYRPLSTILDQQRHLKALRREKERELAREKEQIKKLDREKERARETKEVLELKAAREALLERLRFECGY
ncbi:SprT-like multi-domain protein [Pyrenophora tritici-repentis]|nr:SprT-like multi-domain protein [Pyrenophora tritici-repentis]